MKLTLDWKPEPEFGGFYAAKQQRRVREERSSTSTSRAPEQGAPTWQLVATGKTDFATTAADQVLIARDQGADVVAIFAVYQTSRRASWSTRPADSPRWPTSSPIPARWRRKTTPGSSSAGKALRRSAVTLTGYTGGVAAFLAKPDYSQQCFVSQRADPRPQAGPGGDPQTFLVAEPGTTPTPPS